MCYEDPEPSTVTSCLPSHLCRLPLAPAARPSRKSYSQSGLTDCGSRVVETKGPYALGIWGLIGDRLRFVLAILEGFMRATRKAMNQCCKEPAMDNVMLFL